MAVFSTWLAHEKERVLAGSAILILAGWTGHLVGLPRYYFNILMFLAAVLAGYRIAQAAWRLLKYRVLGIQALVTVAATGALFIGEYWEAAAVTFLFALGGYLEARTLERTRRALQGLMDLAPQKARVRREGAEVDVPAEEVQPGEVVLIRPGEKIPVDGRVVAGRATVNQAAITGESVPVSREPGDEVFGGTVLELGYLEVETTRVGEDTTLGRIIQLVEEAQEAKAPAQLFIERFARYYTPAIMVLAAAVFIFTRDGAMALTLLVIGCPGALVVAAPVSMVAAIGNAARNGTLVKGGAHMEQVGRVTAVAFDKTGTLTLGRPMVVGVRAFHGAAEELLLAAAAAEQPSEHHLGRAIVAAAEDELPGAEDFQVVPGLGVKATVAGQRVLVGNQRWLAEHGVEVPPQAVAHQGVEEERGRTVVLVARGDNFLGTISLADTVREGAREAVQRLKGMGIRRVVMLTGDNAAAARAVGEAVGLDGVYAGLLPEEKVQVLAGLKEEGYVVAMVGDGINDAPALAGAHVGIAMGGTGTDVALETADMVLMTDRLDRLASAIALGRRTLAIIRQNITFAVAVVLLLLAGVLGKKVFLSSGMLVHEASVLLVLLNAMRLLPGRH